MSEEQAVLVDVADGVMTVTLNRPKAKNAANRALAEGVMDFGPQGRSVGKTYGGTRHDGRCEIHACASDHQGVGE